MLNSQKYLISLHFKQFVAESTTKRSYVVELQSSDVLTLVS